MISTIILTKDESKNIKSCIDSLNWCDDIHVLDSGSSDNTVEICKSKGVKVYYNAFESFGKQRNFALNNIETKYEWILFLDADERSTAEFKDSIFDAINNSTDKIAGYFCCWKMILDDVWLKRCDNFPKWQFRLMHKNRAFFTDYGHGQKEADVKGEILYIKVPYIHYGFSKGWFNWIERHNNYSTLEAIERIHNVPTFSNIFSKHGSIRNPALKAWLIKLPGWPLLRFIHTYFINLGILEGKPGFIYCVNMAYYEFLIQIKIRENKFQQIKQF